MTALEMAGLLGGRTLKVKLVRSPELLPNLAAAWEVRVLEIRRVVFTVVDGDLDRALLRVAQWAAPPAPEPVVGMSTHSFPVVVPDDTIPPGEVHLVHPETGEVLAKIGGLLGDPK